jgi:hypothetical protein
MASNAFVCSMLSRCCLTSKLLRCREGSQSSEQVGRESPCSYELSNIEHMVDLWKNVIGQVLGHGSAWPGARARDASLKSRAIAHMPLWSDFVYALRLSTTHCYDASLQSPVMSVNFVSCPSTQLPCLCEPVQFLRTCHVCTEHRGAPQDTRCTLRRP